MKKFKGLLSYFLTICLLVLAVPNCFAAQGGSVTSGVINLKIMVTDDTNQTKKYGQQPQDLVTAVENSFTAASNYLYNATKGQNRFGTITIYVPASKDGGWPEIKGALPLDNFDPEKSDVYIRPGTGASANVNGFMGSDDEHMYIGINSAFTQGTMSMGKTITHEFGHYGYGLGDEYCDYSNKMQVFGRNDNGTILWDTCTNGTSMTISDAAGNALIQVPQGTTYMPSYNSNGQPASIMWVQHENSIIDFCDASNHNTQVPSNQNRINKKQSCWETMVANSKFNLTAPSGKITTITNDAPVFEVRQASNRNDVELIIDRSGSMYGDKLTLAKSAAMMYVDMTDLPTGTTSGDGIGVVSFDDSINVDQSLIPINKAIDKANVKSVIGSINSGDSTNIGSALLAALNDLNSHNFKQGAAAMILLSDGMHNTGTDPSQVLPSIHGKGIPVYTIGLGSDADLAQLRAIANQTGGEFYYADSATSIGLIYKTIKSKLSIFDRIEKFFLQNFSAAEQSSKTIFVDSSMKTARFSITSLKSKDIAFSLKSPDGKVYTSDSPNDAEYIAEDTYQIYTINNPVPGAWEVIIENKSGSDTLVAFDLSGKTPISLQGSTNSTTYKAPSSVRITALLNKSGTPVTDANVYAVITSPNKQAKTITLHDDGFMGDIMPGDGLYTGYFSDFSGDGEYQVMLSADNDKLAAVEGESFPDMPDGSNGQSVTSEKKLINENFNRQIFLPSFKVTDSSNSLSLIQLSNDTITLDENNLTRPVTVQRFGNLNSTASIAYSTSNDSAISGSDYEDLNGTLTFDSGETTKTIDVKALKIPTSPTEARFKTFRLELSNPQNAILGVPSSAEVSIARGKASDNADLKDLKVSCGKFDNEFSPETTEYNLSVPFSTQNTSVTASVYGSGSSLTIKGMNVLSGVPSSEINLNVGSNTIPVVVTAEDGITKKTYNINITRAESAGSKASNNADLKNLIVSCGQFDKVFSPETTEYNLSVLFSTQNTSVTASVYDSGSSLSIKGMNGLSGVPSSNISLNVGSNTIPVVVTAEDGKTQKTYNINISRAESTGGGIGDSGSTTTTPTPTPTPTTTPTPTPTTTPTPTPTPTPTGKVDDTDKPKSGLPSDAVGHWAFEDIMSLINNKVITGYPDGTIHPDSKITRAEATTIAVKSLNEVASSGNLTFTDNIPDWAIGFVKTAVDKKIILGYNDNTFRAQNNLTRCEMVAIVMRAFNLGESDKPLTFADNDDIPQWAKGYISKAVDLSIVKGYSDNSFKPNQGVTRAEVIALINRCMKLKK